MTGKTLQQKSQELKKVLRDSYEQFYARSG
jgi:hypothetical protein